jgi:hypothetical protein
MELSPFGVRTTPGTFRATEGVMLYHTWTDEGVVAAQLKTANKCGNCRRHGVSRVGAKHRSLA